MNMCKRRGKSMVISFRWCASLIMVVMLSGCSKIIDWGKQSFNQGTDISYDIDLIERYIQAVSVYNEGTTLAKFDALWLGDEVRTEYARMHVLTMGKGEEQYQGLLRRQLEENKHFITFYVLSIYENSLGSIDSEWRVSLRVNDQEFAPTEIKVVELVPEYQLFLRKHLNRFRVPYRIMFDARDMEDALLLREETATIELVFRSMQKQVSLIWYIDRDNKVIEPPKEVCENGEIKMKYNYVRTKKARRCR